MWAISMNKEKVINRIILKGAPRKDYDLIVNDLESELSKNLLCVIGNFFTEVELSVMEVVEIDSIEDHDIVIPFNLIH